jgi:hypothetical protein
MKKGAVNLFGIVNDTEKKVKLVLDQRLVSAEKAGFHPMQNDATTSITIAGLHKIIELSGRTAEILDFSSLQSEAAPTAETKQAPAAKKPQQAKKVEEKKENAHQLGIEYTKE